MKISKITLILLSLLSLNSLHAKKYPSGTDPNVFDVAILLERVKSNGHSSEESLVRHKKVNELTITKELRNFINDEEAIIVSAPLFRGLLNAADQDSSYKDVEDNLFYSKKWSIFATNDKEFVILVPKSKYPEIKDRSHLPKIGLDNNKLFTINYYYWHKKRPDRTKETDRLQVAYTPYEAYQKLKEQESMKKGKRGKINIYSLTNLFSGKKDIRAYLTGHGWGKKGEVLIANLKEDQYITLRNKLNNAGCSFLYVSTSFGGGTVKDVQTAARLYGEAIEEFIKRLRRTEKFEERKRKLIIKNIKQLIEKYKEAPMSGKKFIEVVEGLRGESVYGSKTQIADFFARVNTFMAEQYNEFRQRIKKSSTVEKEHKTPILKNLTEQQVLSGKFSIEGDRCYYDYNPLIERKPNIKDSYVFKRIFKNFIIRDKKNIPRCRFPGDKKMSYITGVV